MMEINETKWNQLVKRLDSVENSVFEDRKDIDKILIKLATIEEQNNRILGMQTKQTEKTTEAVKNAVHEVTEPMAEQIDTLVEKKVIPLKQGQIEKLTWLQKLKTTVRGWNK